MKQWAAAGIPPGRLRTMVRTGELVRLRHGAYATASAVATAGEDKALRHALEVRAALAACSAGSAVASHESAALVHGLGLLKAPADGAVTLTRPPGADQGRSGGGVRSYAARLPVEHVVTRHGTPVTTVNRTVVDLSRTLPFMDAVVVADDAIGKLKASKSGMAKVITACAGWPGAARARRVMEFSSGRSESPLESCARVVFDAFGLPPPELQAEIIVGISDAPDGTVLVGDYHEFRVDFLWRDAKTIAEADGLTKYSSGAAAIKELKRDRLLREEGYKVIHLTWAEVLHQPQRVIDRILRAFQATTAY